MMSSASGTPPAAPEPAMASTRCRSSPSEPAAPGGDLPAGPAADRRLARRCDQALRKGDCLPLTILNMQVLTTVLVAQAGGRTVVMDRTDAAGVAEWVRGERITTWYGPPALIANLASDPNVAPGDLATLDEVWTGGADCPEPIRAAFEHKFGRPVFVTYGLTEAPRVVTIDGRDGRHVAGASGRALPHLEGRSSGTTVRWVWARPARSASVR